MKKVVIFLVGPTAIGKSEVAVELAEAIGAEIISCDSMQAYKGMDIGTAKPPLSLRRQVPHHLIDIMGPLEGYSCAEFNERAKVLIEEIFGRGRVPLVVGGSGLYVKALVDGIFVSPGPDWGLRNLLYLQAQRYGDEFLYEMLAKVDPAAAARLHPNDRRRIVRALEVYEKTGFPISNLQPNREGIFSRYEVVVIGLARRRDDLYRRINERVDRMFDEGLVGEVKNLADKGMGLVARQALGYKEIFGYLEGKYDLEEARRLLKRNTRRFAKRQFSWFRRDKRVRWIEIGRDEGVKEVLQKVLKEIGNSFVVGVTLSQGGSTALR